MMKRAVDLPACVMVSTAIAEAGAKTINVRDVADVCLAGYRPSRASRSAAVDEPPILLPLNVTDDAAPFACGYAEVASRTVEKRSHLYVQSSVLMR
jgi:hypothetical protein